MNNEWIDGMNEVFNEFSPTIFKGFTFVIEVRFIQKIKATLVTKFLTVKSYTTTNDWICFS